jgi:hypothetical protein
MHGWGYHQPMCAKQSLKQPVREAMLAVCTDGVMPSLTPVNTIRSGYHSWRPSSRGAVRSPVRNDAGRNAKPKGSSVKVSSPVKLDVPEWPSVYGVSEAVMASAAKATSVGFIPTDTLGVQVHGMYRRLFQELGRSPWVISMKKPNGLQGVMPKWSVISSREVRWFHSSEEVE